MDFRAASSFGSDSEVITDGKREDLLLGMIGLLDRSGEVKPNGEHRDVETKSHADRPSESVGKIEIKLIPTNRTKIRERRDAKHLHNRNRILEIHAEHSLTAKRRIITTSDSSRERRDITILDTANRTRTAKEHTIIDRDHLIVKRINRLKTCRNHEDMPVTLPDREILPVRSSNAPPGIISTSSINEQHSAAARSWRTVIIAVVVAPEDTEHTFRGVTILTFLIHKHLLGVTVIAELSGFDVVHLDKLTSKTDTETSERIPRRPELNRIREGDSATVTIKIVFVVPTTATITLDR